MARTSKCKKCEKKIVKEEKYIVSGKGYCEDCYEDILIEKESYKNLISIVCEYFNIEKPTGLILKQIKQYRDEFNYSTSGITYTLWYIKEIEGKSFNEVKYGIALVKYYYEKAKQYFEQQERISRSVDNFEIKTREVKLNINKVYDKKKDHLTINLEDLIGGE
jgi:hypothetical protein